MSRNRDIEELSLDALRDDCWNAVYMPLPQNPSASLLREAHLNSEHCYEAASNRAEDPDWHGISAFDPPLSGNDRRGEASEHAKAALARLEELERLDPTLARSGPRSESAERDGVASAEPSPDVSPETDPAEDKRREIDEARDARQAEQRIAGQEAAIAPSGSAASDTYENIEMTDAQRSRMERLSRDGGGDEHSQDRDDDPDQAREAPGSGRTRGP